MNSIPAVAKALLLIGVFALVAWLATAKIGAQVSAIKKAV